jgi:hypothetical protein
MLTHTQMTLFLIAMLSILAEAADRRKGDPMRKGLLRLVLTMLLLLLVKCENTTTDRRKVPSPAESATAQQSAMSTPAPSPHPGATALAANRVLIGEAVKDGTVEAEIRGQGSISALSVTLTKKTEGAVVVVVPPGTYFAPESNLEAQAYWSADQVTVPFLAGNRNSLDIPVVKYVLQPGSISKDVLLFVHDAPVDTIPKVLDFMVKNGMSHEAKQLAVGIIQNPNLTRDEIDGMYYVSHSGYMYYTEEAVKVDDPIHAFMALRHAGVALDLIKLYGEQVSLVHGLGSEDAKVRQFAMSELVHLQALDKSVLDSGDCKEALLRFLNHDNRSVRYRAVLGLRNHKGSDIVRALLPLLTDDVTVYAFPSVILGRSTTQTIHGDVVNILRNLRDDYEDQLTPLLDDPDYKRRLAGIEIFRGDASEPVRAALAKLAERDEFKQVRVAAEEALKKEN